MKKHLNLFLLFTLLLVGAGVFLAGVGWGLPSHRMDSYLFGQHPVWTGKEIVALGGLPATDNARAADVSANPIDRTHAVVVNETDEQRARIVRRYRLMSYQPDEYVTFAGLAAMKPAQHDFDPRMYKYGGLWIYPVGALLKLSSIAGFVQLKADTAWYLDHPEAFGRFYVVARVYSALWGLIGIVAVFMLVRASGGGLPAAFVGALCYLLMPIVVNAAHEAKPHLGGSVLMLLCVLSAGRYAGSGSRRWWFAAVILAGMALGLVLSSLPILLVLVVMECIHEWPLTKASFSRFLFRTVGGLLIAVGVFFATNPYIAINLVRNRVLLHSSFSGTASFYVASWRGLPNALLLVGIATSFVLAIAGCSGILACIRRIWSISSTDGAEGIRQQATHLLLVILALSVAAQFALFAYRQPGDYARFALFFDICLAIEAVIWMEAAFRSCGARAIGFALLILTTGWMGSLYVRGFVRDTFAATTRSLAAAQIQETLNHGNARIAIPLEPAPWNLPPVDLWRGTLIVYPHMKPDTKVSDVQAAITYKDLNFEKQPRVSELLCSTPASWASKPFHIQVIEQR